MYNWSTPLAGIWLLHTIFKLKFFFIKCFDNVINDAKRIGTCCTDLISFFDCRIKRSYCPPSKVYRPWDTACMPAWEQPISTMSMD